MFFVDQIDFQSASVATAWCEISHDSRNYSCWRMFYFASVSCESALSDFSCSLFALQVYDRHAHINRVHCILLFAENSRGYWQRCLLHCLLHCCSQSLPLQPRIRHGLWNIEQVIIVEIYLLSLSSQL